MAIEPLQQKNYIGGILLIAGSCIGAGMLGLPILSAQAGFQPSLVVFAICWVFMVCTGFLLLEVNLWFNQEISLVSMAERTLGPIGKYLTWTVFLFLFYCLMVAYVAASGSLVSDFFETHFHFVLDPILGSTAFCLFFGYLVYLGTNAVDWFNRILMLGLVVAYVGLLLVGLPHVKKDYLAHQNWQFAPMVIPAIIVSFGFHNLIPSLTSYFYRDVNVLKRVIVWGSLIPFMIYILWEGLILGIVSLQYFAKALSQGDVATEALGEVVGNSWVLEMAQGFAFFAIMTSFLSVALSFVDFLSDGLKIKKTSLGKLILIALVLVPPFVCSLFYPTIFLKALNAAGGLGTMILFGLLPVCMVWKGRYIQKLNQRQLLPGGKIMLIGIAAFAIGVIILQSFPL